MGFFSWKTSDTNKSISNRYSNRGAFPIYVLKPNGTAIYEEYYEGYGVFGGEDIYALVARWNKPELCNGIDDDDRSVGIHIACNDSDNANLKYPIKIVEHLTNYNSASPSNSCEYQGYFY